MVLGLTPLVTPSDSCNCDPSDTCITGGSIVTANCVLLVVITPHSGGVMSVLFLPQSGVFLLLEVTIMQAYCPQKWCSGKACQKVMSPVLFLPQSGVFLLLTYSNYLRSLKWLVLITKKWCHQFAVKKVMSPVWWHKNEFQVCWGASSSNTRSMVSTISHQCITILPAIPFLPQPEVF